MNLISNLDVNSRIEEISSPNQVYAWFLRKAFVEEGIDAAFVKDSKLRHEPPPEADHTVVVSAAAYTYMLSVDGYANRLIESTSGELVSYMNTERMRGGDRWFDHCFTQVPPRVGGPEKYVCAGWGVDPAYCYPEQEEKAGFLDSRVLHTYIKNAMFTNVYRIYDRVLPQTDIKVYNPVPVYNKDKRIPYPEYQAILRKCHFFFCTQFGDGGLNRLEAAACGALLVVPVKLYRKKTMRLLNHGVWKTEADLAKILRRPVHIEANRKRALEHTWGKVVKRILDVLAL